VPTRITQAELDAVKGAIADAEAGRATLVGLARAHDICERAGATRTLGVVREHIRRQTPNQEGFHFLRAVFAGLLSGSIVALTLGRRR
jgi:hypothetical protein